MATALAVGPRGAPEAPVGREMKERNARTATPVSAAGGIVIGVPLTALGVLLALVGLGVIGRGGARTDQPWWLATAIGGVFAWAGASFLVHSALELWRRRRVRALERRHPGQPWWSDHAWDPRGVRDDTPAEAVRAVCVALLILLFLAPFHWFGFFAPDRVVAFGVVALVFDACAAVALWRAIYLLLRTMKYGRGALAFARFPFRPGERVEVYLAAPRGVAGPDAIAATIRCVQERFEVRGTGRNRTTVTVCYELLSLPASVTAVAGGAGGTAYRVAAELPPDAPPTALAERPPRYWELELAAPTPGVDYGGRFLIPVY